MKRHAFIISDGTGITAENLAHSLLTQFNNIDFEKHITPYIDTLPKAQTAVEQINLVFKNTGVKPLVFMTLINPDIANAIKQANACVLDLFNTFLGPLEKELGEKSSYTVGRAHGFSQAYTHRIIAVDYALAHDDGVKIKGYDQADIILIGVSRCGKTPSCLYMALHFGILAANYPFTEDESSYSRLPESLRPYKNKLFGLTIDAERLQQIRNERRPNSRYASAEQCRLEVLEVEGMYKRENIPYLNTTRFSVEEIATKIISIAGIPRKF
ncbi:posphoenolpyruvate synthetase regulatory kinase/phosphorylase PpsR [Legionella sp. CNM-1927-20]|uniref:posphoenolpyruvate synthetase regulatory kinase/phosphorylase PpsR n=1 Tax=Legionella sp. CNM-1927-20 TaxID=3422221 RepID=UPI00403AFBD5